MPSLPKNIADDAEPRTVDPAATPAAAALPDDAGTHSLFGRVVAGLRRRVRRFWRRVAGPPDAAAIAAAVRCVEEAVALHRRAGVARSDGQRETIAEALRLTGRREWAAIWQQDVVREQAVAPESGNAGRSSTVSQADATRLAQTTIARAERAARLLIEASARAARAFEGQADSLPQSITPDDGRLACVRSWLAGLNAEMEAGRDEATIEVADVGCGSGRFIRALLHDFPRLHWTGVDVASAMLDRLPPEVARVQASLLELPCPDDSFDAAFCIEALEHTLYPPGAIEELCRVVKPGGRVLVIDKRRERQDSSDCEPWERWFTAEEVAGWLEPFCIDVEVQAISHGRAGSGLFLAWSGVIRAGR